MYLPGVTHPFTLIFMSITFTEGISVILSFIPDCLSKRVVITYSHEGFSFAHTRFIEGSMTHCKTSWGLAKQGNCDVQLQLMMANYEDVEFIAIMQPLIDRFIFIPKAYMSTRF